MRVGEEGGGGANDLVVLCVWVATRVATRGLCVNDLMVCVCVVEGGPQGGCVYMTSWSVCMCHGGGATRGLCANDEVEVELGVRGVG